jgi:hypothetical protein
VGLGGVGWGPDTVRAGRGGGGLGCFREEDKLQCQTPRLTSTSSGCFEQQLKFIDKLAFQ